MPGLCGIIEIGGHRGEPTVRSREEISALLRRMETALAHFPEDRTRYRFESGAFHIAAVGYPSACHRVTCSGGDGWSEVWFGEVHHGRRSVAGESPDDPDRWLGDAGGGPSVGPLLASLAGSFTGLRFRASSGEFEIFNDVLGSLPLCVRRVGDLLLFAPEAKALLEPNTAALELDGPALAFFLSIGYLPPGHTRVHGISMLPPASILSGVAASTAGGATSNSGGSGGVSNAALSERAGTDGALVTRRYWNYGFPERIENRGRAFYLDQISEKLREIVSGHIRVEERTGICLSGGHDSRSLLGAARDLGRPIGGVTWGWNPDLAGSDAEVSRRLAEAAGMRHRFVELDLHALPAHAESWVWMTDGSIEGMYNYPQGAEVFRGLAGEYDVLLRGDQSFVKWPFGVPNMAVAQAAVGLYPFAWHGIYDDLILPEPRRRLTEAGRGVARELNARLRSRSLFDRKDEIFYEVHLYSKMNALNYFKTLAVPVRNPLIDRRFLELVQGIPTELRRGKSLFREVVETRSGFSAIPYATRSNLIPWREAIGGAPAVAAFFRSRLLDAGPGFFEIVDRDRLETQLASWLDGGTRAAAKPGGGRRPPRFAERAKRIAYSRWSPGFVRDRIVPPRSQRRAFDYLFRLLVTAIHLDALSERGIRANWNWSHPEVDRA